MQIKYKLSHRPDIDNNSFRIYTVNVKLCNYAGIIYMQKIIRGTRQMKNQENIQEQDKLKNQEKARKLALIISLVDLVAGVLGIIAFYSDSSLISVFGAIVIALSVAQIVLGHQIVVPIICAVVGWIAVSNFWIGICIGMCYEAVITGLFAYILVAIAKIKGPPPAPLAEVMAENVDKTQKDDISKNEE